MTELILALDLGSTSWKAALFHADGRLAALTRKPTPTVPEDGCPCFDPRALPDALGTLLRDLPSLDAVQTIALTGMAESGGFVEQQTGRPLTAIRPWYDRRSVPLFDRLKDTPLFAARPAVTGLPMSFKYGIFKLLAMKEELSLPLDQVCFLGVVEQAALLLTGVMATDETLAARTLAFDLTARRWDEPFLQALRLPLSILPQVAASGAPVGVTRGDVLRLRAGIPVCVGGHDHVCAAYGADLLQGGGVLLSMGTAQVMLCGRDRFFPADTETGLSFGPSPVGGAYTCLGSIQSAGASINYWKSLLFPGCDYGAMMAEADVAPWPTGLTYLPYLAGSGAPHLEPHAAGTLAGLRADTTRGTILAGVYEGLAMESRFVLSAMGSHSRLVCAGGLTRHRRLMQTLSDVTGAQVCLPALDEATLYGAARMASGPQTGTERLPAMTLSETFSPDTERHAAYEQLYSERYLPLMRLTISNRKAVSL